MTENEWLACTDPQPMLELLREGWPASDRKLRLFTAACCRRAWHLLDADARSAVEASERFADGEASEAELKAAIWANLGCQSIEVRAAIDSAAVGAWRPAVSSLAAVCSRQPDTDVSTTDPVALARERAAQTVLLRDVFGPLPFRPVVVDPSWLMWNGSTILAMVRAIYEEKAFDRLPVLADALEDAGCTDTVLLAHLRGPGPHIRGCFALDAILGKT